MQYAPSRVDHSTCAPPDVLTGSLPAKLTVSAFPAPATTSTTPTRREVTPTELVTALTTHERRADKDGQGWSPATYKPGTTRANANVEQVSLYVADVDKITTDDYVEIRAGLIERGLKFVVHSTHSSTPELLSLRFALFLTEPVQPDHWPDIWQRINHFIFGGRNDPQTKDQSRFSYLPAAPEGVVVLAEHHEGLALNPRALPPAPARVLGPVTNGEISRGAVDYLGYPTLTFLALGADSGKQRNAALAATRALLASGKSIEETAELVWGALQKSPCGDPSKPWTHDDALKFAQDLAKRPAPPLQEYPDLEPGEPASNGHANLPTSGDLPEIDAGELDLRIVTQQAWNAIDLANRRRPALFRHGGIPVRIERDDEARPILRELTIDHIRHELARAAEFSVVKATKEKDQAGNEQQRTTRKVVLPPTHVCRDVLATPDPPLPIITRITESPVFATNGSLQTAPGYHADSRTYLAIPADLLIPPVPERPSSQDVARARALITEDMLGDFPFVSGPDLANTVALGLEPFVRAMINGPVPLHGLEAPIAGSGKGLLAEAILRPSCGRNVGAVAQAESEDEWRKRITSVLLRGFPAVQIDNVNRPLESGSLSMALTIPTWTDRILGQTRTVSIPVRCSWVVTANNPTFSTEMARRTIRSRIDPRCDRPQDREGWRHPELLGWIDTHRGELIWAFCVLVRAWVADGRPAFSGRALGSYERWSHIVGGILDNAGIPGFLANQANFYELADVEVTVWRSVVAAWWEKFSDSTVGTNDLFPLALEVDGLDLGGGNERSQKTKFGKALGQQRDRVIDGHRVAYAGEHRRASRWRLLRVNVVNVCERSDPSLYAMKMGNLENDNRPEGETFVNVHNVHTPTPDLALAPDWMRDEDYATRERWRREQAADDDDEQELPL